MIGFVSIESPYSPFPVGMEAIANVNQIPLELLQLFDHCRYWSLSEIVYMLKKLGIIEILTNGSDEPSYDSKKVAEKLIAKGYVDCPITPPQARWFVDNMLAVVAQIFSQENEGDRKAKQLLNIILNRILGKKEIILRNGRNELNTHKFNFFDWIMTACRLGNIVLSPEKEQILKKYLESRKTGSRSELSYIRTQFGL